jgi:uncharacterized protein DUF6894
MTRYFFDVVSQERSQHDFRGRDLPTLEEARRLADLMAIDLATGPEDQWTAGWSIAVRCADGRELFAVPIQALALTAA